MSHFTVLVITNESPTDDVLSKVLMPFHEYECTGVELYLQDVDVTDEVIKYFGEPQKVVILADGAVRSRWDEGFYTKKPTEKFGNKQFELPAGAREEEMDAVTARSHGVGHPDLATAANEYYGSAFERDGRWYHRTNPNKKWDWYSRGGRWRGKMKVKPGVTEFFTGQPGVFDNEPLREDGVDSCQVKDLDLAGMRAETAAKADEYYGKMHAVIAGRTWETWAEVLKRYERQHERDPGLFKDKGEAIEAARNAYHGQGAVKDVQADRSLRSFDGPDDCRCDRDTYLQRARDGAFATFAVLKDGNWYENGKMGWWGIITDEQDTDVWHAEFAKLVSNLPPETWLTVVDCHI